MGARGPNKTPIVQLKAVGSWRGELNPNEPKPDPTMPEKPVRLAEAAGKIWDELAGILHDAGLLTAADGRAFSRLCQMYADCDAAQAWLDDPENEGWSSYDTRDDRKFVITPQRKIVDTLHAAILRLESHFGLTPSARASLSVPAIGKPVDDEEAQKRSLLNV